MTENQGFRTAEDLVKSVVAGTWGFAAEMREKGIHVGMGTPGTCVNCGESWPCTGSRDV